MDTKAKNRLADKVQTATAEALQAMSCPDCARGLDVQFAPRKEKGAGSLSVMCSNCMWRVISDGVGKVPPWVAELGKKAHTAASPVAMP